MSNCPFCGVSEGRVHMRGCAYIGGGDAHKRNTFDPYEAPAPKAPAPLEINLPPEVEPYRHDIRRFVDAMVYKLKVHAKKGRWEGLDARSQLAHLAGEVNELVAALDGGNTIEILCESADVANYAMIISSITVERGE